MTALLIGWFTFIWHKESVAPILALIVGITLNSDVTTRLAGNIDIVSLTKVLSHVGHGSAVFIMHVQKFGRAVVPIRFLARVGHVNSDVNSLSETKSYGPYASIGIPIRILRESGTFYDSESGWEFLCYPSACSVYLRILKKNGGSYSVYEIKNQGFATCANLIFPSNQYTVFLVIKSPCLHRVSFHSHDKCKSREAKLHKISLGWYCVSTSSFN